MQEEKRKMQTLDNNDRDIDCTGVSRGLWLVKVPKYISNRWNQSQAATDVGRLRITTLPRKPDGTKPSPTVVFSLHDSLVEKQGEDVAIPKEHRFEIGNVNLQSLAVVSQNADSKLALEGTVVHRAECRSITGDERYLQLKTQCFMKASKPQRVVKQLDRVVNTYKPVSDHKHNIEYEKSKKDHGKKSRGDKDKIMELLFAAFEKHQYYNLKDLVRITSQPVTYLKEILKEICNYNLKNPHKNMWELKAEYRHYHDEQDEAE